MSLINPLSENIKKKILKIEKKTNIKSSSTQTKQNNKTIKNNKLLELSQFSKTEFKDSSPKTLINDFINKLGNKDFSKLSELPLTLNDNIIYNYFEERLSDENNKKITEDDEYIQKLKKGYSQNATVMFLDIRNFTVTAHEMKPEKVFSLLNYVFPFFIHTISHKFNGTVDKIIGDAIMAYFGLPVEESQKTHQLRAIECAVTLQKSVKIINQQLEQLGYPAIHIGIGINSGEIKAGFIGGTDCYKSYTIIGDTVNLASKFEGIASANEILIGETLIDYVSNEYDINPKYKTYNLNNKEIKCYSVYY